MCKKVKIHTRISGSGFFLILILSCNYTYSQTETKKNEFTRVPAHIIINVRDHLPELSRDTLSGSLSNLRAPVKPKEKSDLFYDSLKVRASKNPFTKKLYDAIIVNHDTIYKKKFTSTSDANYFIHSGKIIRKIEIRRLNVFGADINYPASYDPNKIEKVLNKTHFNTAEGIIRKNLLFSEGDRISPLVLSENERLLRELPYISDARIIIFPVSDTEADIIVYTRDIYSLGGTYTFNGLKKGAVSVFDRNIFGIGHELGIDVPFDNEKPHSPGFGLHYNINNISKSFINLNLFYLYGLGDKTYGFAATRKLVSSSTKYAGGISVKQMYTTDDLDTLKVPAPVKFNFQDYYLLRSFLINPQSVTRIIAGVRYTNNNVFDHPDIQPDSYHNLQRYKVILGSAAFSMQKYTKANLVYGYGRTEDVPYGALFKITAGKEFNEFKDRTYIGGEASVGNKDDRLGYIYFYSGFSTYLNKGKSEQGLLSLRLDFFSNLMNLGNFRLRNFAYLQYTRGFGRYSNEYLRFIEDNGFTGFKNDSVNGNQRLTLSLESVLFSPVNLVGFRFAFFGFADFSFLAGTNELIGKGYALSSLGIGVRIRNDNLIFNTLQIRLSYFPNPPSYSRISSINVSGEQLLSPQNFESGPPGVILYR
jgi:hypothetical protein